MACGPICTIGYEGRSIDDVLRGLLEARIERVVDVRALPLSRKRGFSKTALGEHLRARGIDYRHVRAAGNPYRELKHDPARCLALYARHLDRTPEALQEVADAIAGQRSALLCFEAQHERCHRAVLAERLVANGTAPRAEHL